MQKQLFTGPLATVIDVVGALVLIAIVILAQYQFIHHHTVLGWVDAIGGAALTLIRLELGRTMRRLIRNQNQLIDAYKKLTGGNFKCEH